ncbi:MAG: sigma 54-interacting transcriptional regulator [Kofleriaceae bacterium]|nr:sigma 54-interacting transcriptional regulator [Kofleriaceae bacterium]
MSSGNRSRKAEWKTRALLATSKERRIREFRVEVVGGRDLGVTAAASGSEFSIGTSKGNSIVITDAAVSRHHCEIEATADGFLLKDLGSTNGTTLSGHRVTGGYLESGDVIGLGETQLRFECGENEILQALSESSSFAGVLGTSVAMRRLFYLLNKVSEVGATVLMTGETGTGKGALAKALHEQGSRSDKPFVVLDCGAISDNLIESEFFGHEKGAFTGAEELRKGAFELADGGTLFLDEIGELGIDMQPKLLRVLENREFRRVGGSDTITTDIQVIAATNRDLRQEINQGGFREDLFYRLNVMNIEVPPLRDRRGDIPMLVELFYRAFIKDDTATPPAELIQRLVRKNFPGNVRELKSAVERSLVLGELCIPDEAVQRESGLDFTLTYRQAKEQALGEWEAQYIPQLVARYDGNLSRAARAVSMDRNHLRKMLKALGDE